MFSLSPFLVLTILLFTAGAEEEYEMEEDLGFTVLACLLFSNGDMTPYHLCPADPYGDLSYWPKGWGQLSNMGIDQHYQLGRWFRKRYDDLLPSTYAEEDILVRSADSNLTFMSAASNLAGLYPPEGLQVWNANNTWQSIPIHTLPENMDNILAATKNCPKYDAELKAVKQSEDIQALNRHYFELMSYLTSYCGRNISDLQDIEFVYNSLFVEQLFNFTLPKWTESIFPKKMIVPAAKSFIIPAYNLILQRLKSGPLLGEIVSHMKNKADGTLSPDRKMFMYSGYDTTIANMLMTLGAFNPHNPAYTATIMFELRVNRYAEYVVVVWYRNSSSAEPMLLTLPDCVPACPLDNFEELTKNMVPEDWEKECHYRTSSSTKFKETNFKALNSTMMIYNTADSTHKNFDNLEIHAARYNSTGTTSTSTIFFGSYAKFVLLGMIVIGLSVLIILVLSCKLCGKQGDPYLYRPLPITTDEE